MKPKIEPERFVRLWLEAVDRKGGLLYIAEQLHVSRQAVDQYGAKLRKAGVKLPKMPHKLHVREFRTIDVVGLNNMLASPSISKKSKDE